MRAFSTSLLLAALALALPACDTYDSGYDDGFIDGSNNAPTNGATFVDFTLDATNYAVSGDQKTATYESDDIDSGTVRAAVERALDRAGDGALVMLYIRNDLVNNLGTGASQPYTALPLSRGFEEIVLASGENGTTTTVPVVGYVVSYEYSFDNQDLYFDVVSSASAADFSTDPRFLFDAIAPQQTNVNGDRLGATTLRFRLLTVPASAGARSAVDLSDYAAVKAAYNLPD